jgi:hypothetical protein
MNKKLLGLILIIIPITAVFGCFCYYFGLWDALAMSAAVAVGIGGSISTAVGLSYLLD